MTDVATEVRNRLNRMKRGVVAPPKPKVEHKIRMRKKDVSRVNFLTIFLGICILLMTLITAGILVRHTGILTSMLKESQSVDSPTPDEKITTIVERETIIDNPAYITREEAEIRFDKIEGNYADLEKKFKTWSYRSWITAVVVNENAHLAHDVDRRYHPQYQPNYLRLDKNWKLNKMPQKQGLTDDQRRDIERGGFK